MIPLGGKCRSQNQLTESHVPFSSLNSRAFIATSLQIWHAWRSFSVAIQYWRYRMTWLIFCALTWERCASCCVLCTNPDFPSHQDSCQNHKPHIFEIQPVDLCSPIPHHSLGPALSRKLISVQVQLLNDLMPAIAIQSAEFWSCLPYRPRDQVPLHVGASHKYLACISVSLFLLDVDECSIHQEGQKCLCTFVHHIPWREAPRPGWLGCCTHCWVTLDVELTIYQACRLDTSLVIMSSIPANSDQILPLIAKLKE